MAQKLTVTELDYDAIRSNIKAYFTREGSVFKDWDFEGSGLANILDVLAYNTHYNAMLAHMTLNEGFIDTAQIRESVVSHAKLLGYTPKSKRASTAVINAFFSASSSSVEKLILPRGTKFKTTFNGTDYTFVTTEANIASRVPATGGYLFTNMVVAQGILTRASFIVDSNITDRSYIIKDANLDTSSMKVFVRANAGSTLVETFLPFTSLYETTSESQVYFLTENYSGNFQLKFGDGIFGKKLINLQIVEVEYISTQGNVANGAGGVSNSVGNWEYVSGALDPDAISADIDPIITTVFTAVGGDDKEDIESIRFNAPISFIAQNRAVTANDYISLIQKEFGAVDAINVWGGEDADPITPSGAGNVYISIKPNDDILENGTIVTKSKLSETEKDSILKILDTKRVITLKTEFVDPDYTYLYMDVFLKFNPNRTSETPKELESNIYSTIISPFRENQLQKFSGVFRYSKFLAAIDSYNPAILNSFARIYLYKIYENTTYEWTNIKSNIQRVRFNSATNRIYFDTFTNANLVSGMTVTFFGTGGNPGINFPTVTDKTEENIPITVENDYTFSVAIGAGNTTEIASSFGSVWINRAGTLSNNTIDFSAGLFRGQDKTSPLLECAPWSYTYYTSGSGGTAPGYPSRGITGTYATNLVKLLDEAISDSQNTVTYGTRNVYLVRASDNVKLYNSVKVGILDVPTGIVLLDKPISNIPIAAATSFRIDAVPDSNDIAPKRNQLLDLDLKETSVIAEIDTISIGGSAGSINYNTFKKNRNSDNDTAVIN
jgi:hypothetical protein